MVVRILDSLYAPGLVAGKLLKLAPPHHIVMENLMHGKSEAKYRGEEWQSWDLKPTSYFYPERDIANGKLVSEETKKHLLDEFEDKIVLKRSQAEEFWRQLEEDTGFLAEHNAVDYSLFLVRVKTTEGKNNLVNEGEDYSWRTGVRSANGKYLYRAAVLDFFWAKHKTHARAMTMLIDAWRFLTKTQDPMSITADPREYKKRFLSMCREIVEVRD